MNSQLSKNINVLVAIGTIAVVLVHTTDVSPKPESFASDPIGTFDFYITFLLKNVISATGVPLFFFISGYLYFTGLSNFTKNSYLLKTKKRFKTLFLPYIIWIIGTIIVYELLSLISGQGIDEGLLSLKSFWNYSYIKMGLNGTEAFYVPLNSPLWYLRDLIVLCILSPAIYWGSKSKFAKYVLLVLLIWYVSGLYSHITIVLSSTGITFFFAGAFMALRNIDFTIIPRPLQIFTLVLFFLAICSIIAFAPTSIWIKIMSKISSILLILLIMSLVSHISYKENLPLYLIKNHSFFIYAFQGIIVLWFANLLFEYFVPSGLYFRSTFKSITCAFIVLMSSLCVSILVKKYLPKFHRVICGNR